MPVRRLADESRRHYINIWSSGALGFLSNILSLERLNNFLLCVQNVIYLEISVTQNVEHRQIKKRGGMRVGERKRERTKTGTHIWTPEHPKYLKSKKYRQMIEMKDINLRQIYKGIKKWEKQKKPTRDIKNQQSSAESQKGALKLINFNTYVMLYWLIIDNKRSDTKAVWSPPLIQEYNPSNYIGQTIFWSKVKKWHLGNPLRHLWSRPIQSPMLPTSPIWWHTKPRSWSCSLGYAWNDPKYGWL